MTFSDLTSMEWLSGLQNKHAKPLFAGNPNLFLHHLPKIELHAHLNGCIRESTLLELAYERNVTLSSLLHDIKEECHFTAEEKRNESEQTKVNKKRRSLLECFEIFAEIGKCVTDLDALKRIVREALEDFARENVIYLELRSTPKILYVDHSQAQLGQNGKKCTKREYVEVILDAMHAFEEAEDKRYEEEKNEEDLESYLIRLPMKCRYIVSVNRADSVDDAMTHAELAVQLAKEGNKHVVGLDLSGSPLKNTFQALKPAFSLARRAGLPSSIHCGEIPCYENKDNTDSIIRFAYEDTKNILAFEPDRLGHALLLTDTMYEDLEMLSRKIPIECCPTSNVMTLELATHYEGDLVHGLRQHPRLKTWLAEKYPISISTDDPGIFNTNPTTELVLLVHAFRMTNPWQIVRMMYDVIDHIFESSDEFKKYLKVIFVERVNEISPILGEGGEILQAKKN